MITQAVILAGGLGTRLGTITRSIPKPALEVGGRPFIQHLIGKLARCGVHDIIVSTGHLADVMHAALASCNAPVRLRYIEEKSPLGTAGGLMNCSHLLQETFFVLNGDSLLDCDYQFLAGLLDSKTDIAIALRALDDVSRYGAVSLEGDRVRSFLEKGQTGRGLVNGGVYAMSTNVFAHMPKEARSLELEVFPALAIAGRVAGYRCNGFFIDIGIPESLEEARRLLSLGNDRSVDHE